MHLLQEAVNVTLHSAWIRFALDLNTDSQVGIILPIGLKTYRVVITTLTKVIVKFCAHHEKTQGKFAAGLSVMDHTNLTVIADPRAASSQVCQYDLVVDAVACGFDNKPQKSDDSLECLTGWQCHYILRFVINISRGDVSWGKGGFYK